MIVFIQISFKSLPQVDGFTHRMLFLWKSYTIPFFSQETHQLDDEIITLEFDLLCFIVDRGNIKDCSFFHESVSLLRFLSCSSWPQHIFREFIVFISKKDNAHSIRWFFCLVFFFISLFFKLCLFNFNPRIRTEFAKLLQTNADRFF